MSNMSEFAIEQQEQQEQDQAMKNLGLITITKEKLVHLLSSAYYHETFNCFNDSFDNWKKENKIEEL